MPTMLIKKRGLFGTIALLLAALGSGCSPTQPARSGVDLASDLDVDFFLAPKKEAVASQFAHELAAWPPSTAIHGKGWEAEAPEGATVTPGDAKELLSIPLGSRAPIECEIYPSTVAPAALLGMTLDGLAPGAVPVALKPTTLTLEKVTPVALFELQYQVKQGPWRKAGQLKLGLLAHPDLTVLCHHDEPGYLATFGRVVRELGQSLKSESPLPSGETTVQLEHLGTAAVGFSRRTVEKLPTGEEVTVETASQFVPRSATELTVRDTSSRVVAKGESVLSGSWTETGRQGETLRVALGAAKGLKYGVTGVLDGKPVNATLLALKGIASPKAVQRRLGEGLASGKPFKFTMTDFDPQDPTRLTEVAYSHEATDPPRTIHRAARGAEQIMVLDGDGNVIRSRTPRGEDSLIAETVLRQSGAPTVDHAESLTTEPTPPRAVETSPRTAIRAWVAPR